jgi:hypothetical protein
MQYRDFWVEIELPVLYTDSTNMTLDVNHFLVHDLR